MNSVTFSNIMDLRSKHKDAFFKNHGLKLGFMSAFTKAASYALQAMPVVNAGKAKFCILVFSPVFRVLYIAETWYRLFES